MCFGLCIKAFFLITVYSAALFPSIFLYNTFFAPKKSTMQIERFDLDIETSVFTAEQMWRIEPQNKSHSLSLPKMGVVQMILDNPFEHQLVLDIGADKYVCTQPTCIHYLHTPVQMKSVSRRPFLFDRPIAVAFTFMYIG